jgi:hypothetical protein
MPSYERAAKDLPAQESIPLPEPSENVLPSGLQTSEDCRIPGDDNEHIPGSSTAALDFSASILGVSDSDCRENERKKRKISWIYDHVKRLDDVKRSCKFCNKNYGAGFSTGTIISHLKSHNIFQTGTMTAFDSSTARSYLQYSIACEIMPKANDKKLDNAVTLYVLESGIPHAHVESRSFRSFMAVSCPGYDVKSARTIKRRNLQTYAVLKRIVVNTFRETVDSNFSITFDGWSNRNLQGFYAVTIHFFAD